MSSIAQDRRTGLTGERSAEQPPAPSHLADAVPLLVAYVVVLVSVPSELVVGPLGAAGTPAQLIATALFAGWALSRVLILGRRRASAANPLHWLLLAFVVSVLASYAAGMSRPVSTALEVSSSDRALLSLIAWIGIVVVMIDGLRTVGRLETVLRVLAGGAVGIALLGVLQFFFGLDIAHLISIPGLRANQQFGELFQRSQFRRVSGTTSHPIEFGVVLSCLLPLVVHFAVHDTSAIARRRWWWGAALVAGTLPMSVARSGLLGGALAAMFIVPVLPPVARRRTLLASAGGVLAMAFIVPGLLGTLRSLVFNAGSDPSTKGRTDDYGPVLEYARHAPLFGRGVGTFVPSLYRTLDNQYLGTLVEGGVVGLLGLLCLLLGGMACGAVLRARSRDPRVRSLALALVAALVIITVNFATFDALGFAMCAGVLFVVTGALGALWNASGVGSGRPLPRWWAVTVLAAGLGLAAVLAPAAVVGGPTRYHSLAAVLVDAPVPDGTNPYLRLGAADVASSVLRDAVMGADTHERLTARGVDPDYTVTVGDGSQMAGSDVIRSGSILHVSAYADTPQAADFSGDALVEAISSELETLQVNAGVSPSSRLRAVRLDNLSAYPVRGRRVRSLAICALISAVVLGASLSLWRRSRGDEGLTRR